jgi:SPP1 gp7 family putative phage head morphogenesis protein
MLSLNNDYNCSVCLDKSEKAKNLKTEALRKAFANMIEWLHAAGSFRTKDLKLPVIRQLISETAVFFNEAVDANVKVVPPSDPFVRSLKNSGYVFSGFKALAQVKEAECLLLDENGEIKPFEKFLNDVQKIDEAYNENYLKTEYNFAVGSAQMADKWLHFEKDGNDYDLQYRTANDERVRDTHRELHNVTLPFDSSFWNKYFPPNGWGCRCNVVQVRKGKYPVTNLEEALKKGEEATEGKFSKMFRFNPGKDKRLFPYYNPYSLSRCESCSVNGFPLAITPDNDLCESCPAIRRFANNEVKK